MCATRWAVCAQNPPSKQRLYFSYEETQIVQKLSTNRGAYFS